MEFFGQSLENLFRKKKSGIAFRKRLGVFNYKIGKIGYHKRPGATDLKVKEELLAVRICNLVRTIQVRAQDESKQTRS